jgi:hypothetical protein
VVKTFCSPAELGARLAELGWTATIREVDIPILAGTAIPTGTDWSEQSASTSATEPITRSGVGARLLRRSATVLQGRGNPYGGQLLPDALTVTFGSTICIACLHQLDCMSRKVGDLRSP